MGEDDKQQQQQQHFSCTAAFDALWFCYSPVHQLREYYRDGELDNCMGKWGELFNCFKLRTMKVSDAQAVMQQRAKENPHIWEFRTPEEAAEHWKGQFNEEQKQEQQQQQQQEQQQQQSPFIRSRQG